MGTVQSSSPADDQVGRRADKIEPAGHGAFDIHQAIFLLSGGGIGAVLAIVVLGAFRDVGSIGALAITAISGIVGAAIGVVGLEIRRRSRDT